VSDQFRRNDLLIPGSVIVFGTSVLTAALVMVGKFTRLESRLTSLEVRQEFTLRQLERSCPKLP
jgi:hypothetical protein